MDIEGLTKLIEAQSQSISRLEAKIDSAVTEIRADIKELSATLHSVDKRVATLEAQMPHLATQSWVYVTLTVAAVGALGAIGSIFTILNTAGKALGH